MSAKAICYILYALICMLLLFPIGWLYGSVAVGNAVILFTVIGLLDLMLMVLAEAWREDRKK